MNNPCSIVLGLALTFMAGTTLPADDDAATLRLRFTVVDESGEAVPCRIHLFDAQGEPVLAPDLPAWRDHFVCPGEATLELAPGQYRYEIERGPEHQRLSGEVNLADDEAIPLTLNRIVDLPALGWYSGDLHIHRRPEEAPLLLLAEDLHVGQVITWWNQRNLFGDDVPDDPLSLVDRQHCFHVLAGEDERGGGALLYFNVYRPIDITLAEREFPSSMTYLLQARSEFPNCRIDVEKPFWWDVPMWLASGEVDSIGLANNHMCRSRMYEDEAWGRPRDADRLPPPTGNGYWTQEIYYHALNCGLRIPPSAGSASGVLPNPVGYNRVYVHTGDADQLDYEAWWDNLRRGRCFVTNGPLLVVTAEGELPGHVFDGGADAVMLDINLISLDRVPAVEVIQNGGVVQTIECEDAVEQRLTTTIDLEGPGWFLVRAIADNPETFRFASTGPFYVGPADAARVSRASAQFFVDWMEQRRATLERELTDEAQRTSVLEHVDNAQAFWTQLRDNANAD